ncbi:heavy-metal-associated domain-containing protein [Clostridium minihomine]|uniref:heavy-metal-associated domain-containing protein n=1 Tax=Clostridium minihomine TaxID=2045012 RepID=UPI000C789B8C|nr:heavy metal-associated domain-containing protein [Clostridium minihomine]
MESLTCNVSGLQNKEGKTQIKNALKKIDGVSQVGVNLQTGDILVEYNSPATDLEIKSCIERSGFKIDYA